MFHDGYGGRFSSGLMRPRISSVVKTIVLACVAVYVLQLVTLRIVALAGRDLDVTGLLALWPAKVIHQGFLWQIFTYMWLHDPRTIWHLLFNMLVLWMIGGAVEARLGRRQFWLFYIVCGLVAGVCALAASLLAAGGIEGARPIVGASGSIFGVMAAFALMYPDAVLLLMFIIPVRARTAVLVLAGIQLLMLLQMGSAITAVAHLSGMVAGYLMLKGEDPLRYLATRLWGQRRPRARTSEPRQGPDARTGSAPRSDDKLLAELDRVLEKIHREGISSLTTKEKEILRRASERSKG